VVLFNINPRATSRNRRALDALTDLLAGSGSTAFQATIRTSKPTAIDLRQQHLSPVEPVATAEQAKTSRLHHLGAGLGGRDERRPWSRDPAGLAGDDQRLTRFDGAGLRTR
jgi:chromosome partitioning protein